LFTSGTTGRPKAVVASHGPLGHFVAWQRDRFGLRVDDRFALLSAIGHDPMLRDMFAPLCLGATLCLPPVDDLSTDDRLADWVRDAGVTVAHLSPALATFLAATAGPGELPLRLAFLGGDVLTATVADRLRRAAPDAACINLYGATETPQAMGWCAVDDDCWSPAGTAALGTGVDGVQLLVCRPDGTPVAVGERGEIVVRTPHLALGYLRDTASTALRFRPDPAGGGGRVYRTGDLGRYDTLGRLHLVGRSDWVTKVRGVRVEPAEVEAVLVADPSVREAAVAVRGEAEQARLTAWAAPADVWCCPPTNCGPV
jgi:amino acid adenylation domain-containing protein